MADLEEEPSGDFAPQSAGAGEEAGGEASGEDASKHPTRAEGEQAPTDSLLDGDDDSNDASGDLKDESEETLAALQAEIELLNNESDLNFDMGITSSPLNGAASSTAESALIDDDTTSLLAAAEGLVSSSEAPAANNHHGTSSSEPILLDEAEKQQISALSAEVDKQQEDAEETDSRSIYVGNVDYSCTDEQLTRFFSSCGTVDRVTILKDKFTQQPKGFAYVQFADKRAVQNAVQLATSELNGRQLKIAPKRKNLPFFMRGRGRGGGYRGRARGRRPFRGGYRGGGGGYAPRYRGRRSRGYHPYGGGGY